jgi:hypothetical protein
MIIMIIKKNKKKEKENDEKIEKRSWGVLFSGAMAGRKKGERFLFPFY